MIVQKLSDGSYRVKDLAPQDKNTIDKLLNVINNDAKKITGEASKIKGKPDFVEKDFRVLRMMSKNLLIAVDSAIDFVRSHK